MSSSPTYYEHAFQKLLVIRSRASGRRVDKLKGKTLESYFRVFGIVLLGEIMLLFEIEFIRVIVLVREIVLTRQTDLAQNSGVQRRS